MTFNIPMAFQAEIEEFLPNRLPARSTLHGWACMLTLLCPPGQPSPAMLRHQPCRALPQVDKETIGDPLEKVALEAVGESGLLAGTCIAKSLRHVPMCYPCHLGVSGTFIVHNLIDQSPLPSQLVPNHRRLDHAGPAGRAVQGRGTQGDGRDRASVRFLQHPQAHEHPCGRRARGRHRDQEVSLICFGWGLRMGIGCLTCR